MNYYYLRLRIQDGERQYYSRATFSAESFSDAEKYADEYAKNFWDGGFKEDENENGYYHCFGETHVKVDSIESISEEEHLILRKFV